MTATVEHARDQAVHFGLIELDLLATHAGARFPFPLRVPSFGRLADERAALLAAAGHDLCARGLATSRGPVGVAGELVTALREHRSVVDVVVVGASTVTGVAAMIYRNRAVVCHQSQAGVVRATAATLADELTEPIPAVPPAADLPVTMPPGLPLPAMTVPTAYTTDADQMRRHASTLAGYADQLSAIGTRLPDSWPTSRWARSHTRRPQWTK